MLKKAVIILLLIAIAVFAVAPIRFTKASANDWMKNLDDSTAVNALAIPGTHDSGALYSIGGLFGKCQTLNISKH